MKSWHIWDFPDNIYFRFSDNFREEFFNGIFEKFGGKRPYARFLNLDPMSIKSYYRGYTYKNGVKHLQSIPIKVLKKSLSLVDQNLRGNLEDNILLLKAKNRGIPIMNPKLPFKESPAFYRVVAHILGDGSASERKVPYYANTCDELREQFKKDLSIFGEVRAYERKPLTTPLIYFPKVITDILSYILSINFTNPFKIPPQIFQSSEDCKTSFLQALFDDEGTVSTGLVISMSNQRIIEEIKELVESIGVRTNNINSKQNKPWKDNFSLAIKREAIKEFKEKIGFCHPEKIRNLDFSINTLGRKQRTRDKEHLKQIIIKNLKSKQMRTIEIANNIQLTLGHTLNYLKALEKENKVVRIGFRNKILWSLPKV